MTTYKVCVACRDVVPWNPPAMPTEGAGRLIPWSCAGGNDLVLCPHYPTPNMDQPRSET